MSKNKYNFKILKFFDAREKDTCEWAISYLKKHYQFKQGDNYIESLFNADEMLRIEGINQPDKVVIFQKKMMAALRARKSRANRVDRKEYNFVMRSEVSDFLKTIARGQSLNNTLESLIQKEFKLIALNVIDADLPVSDPNSLYGSYTNEIISLKQKITALEINVKSKTILCNEYMNSLKKYILFIEYIKNKYNIDDNEFDDITPEKRAAIIKSSNAIFNDIDSTIAAKVIIKIHHKK